MLKRNKIKVITIVVIAAVLVVAEIIVYQLMKYRTGPLIVTPAILDWQIYRNDDFGFEIQHPSSWSVETQNAGNGIVFLTKEVNNCNKDTAILDCYIGAPSITWQLIATTDFSKEKFDQWVAQLEWLTQVKDVYIANYHAKEGIDQSNFGYPEKNVLFYRDPIVIRISIGLETEYQNEFDLMLSTFKFID